MVTIRNDIESNGNANRADSATSVLEGTKNINHLANGSRRSTMGDMKPKPFNRKCVGILALIVCVGVCFGVGMLFLYGHLEDRLKESTDRGSMMHDKHGNPVKHLSATTTTSRTTTSSSSSSESSPEKSPSSTLPPVVTESSSTTSKEISTKLTLETRREEEDFFVDAVTDDKEKVGVTTAQSTAETSTARADNTNQHLLGRPQYSQPQSPPDDRYSGSGSGDDSDDDEYSDDEPSRDGSGNHK